MHRHTQTHRHTAMKAPISIATTLGIRDGVNRFLGLLYFIIPTYLIMLSVKQRGIKYHVLNLWYESVSKGIGDHALSLSLSLFFLSLSLSIYIYIYIYI